MMQSGTAMLPTGIEVRSGVDRATFEREYLYPQRPVVLTDVLREWPALSTWTPEALRARFAEREFVVKGTTIRFGELIDRLLAEDPNRPAPYLNQELISKRLPELFADLSPMPWCVQPNWLAGRYPHPFINHWFNMGAEVELFIGAAGSGLHQLHYDVMHFNGFSMQIYGRKRFFLYPPEQTRFLYATDNISQVNDILQPDLERFPLFSQARPLVHDLAPGELLFIPPGWWHDTRILNHSLSVSVNTACRSNWADIRRDVCGSVSLAKRVPAWIYLTLIGWFRRVTRG
jgi:histone arginine demethylase JMJD6